MTDADPALPGLSPPAISRSLVILAVVWLAIAAAATLLLLTGVNPPGPAGCLPARPDMVVAAAVVALLPAAFALTLARRARRLERLAGELRAANARPREQMTGRERTESALRPAQRIEAVGQLAGALAHDFNNLLTVVLGNLDLVQQTARLDDATAARLASMRSATERGVRLTAQLLAFACRQPLVPRAVDINAVLSDMGARLESALGSQVRLQTRPAAGLWPALIDPSQIENVVLNLALNARDAMPHGGTLAIGTANVRLGPPGCEEQPPEGDYVRISFADTGTGMSADVLARAFEPFFTTRAAGTGSGLGLSQVYGVVRQSGGDVRIDSAPGIGTTVLVFLPRATANAGHQPPPPVAAVPRAGPASVLLVDDDEDVRCTTAALLRNLGYRTIEVASCAAALGVLRAGAVVDVLLTDVAMPEMTGPELARHVAEWLPSLPVVFCTGYADPESIAGAGVVPRLLRKPFRPAELAAQVEAALAGPAAEPA